MADVFVSYKRSPSRRLLVRRLALILRAHEISVWWDSGIETGKEFSPEIETELDRALIVSPLWCSSSVRSDWVLREAEIGKSKLLPIKIQSVAPPQAFAAIQACDLTGWDGNSRHSAMLGFIRTLHGRLNRQGLSSADMMDELQHLPTIEPLPPYDPHASRVLNELRRAYLDQDPLIEFEDAAALQMDGPIDDFVGPGSAEEQFEELWRILSDGNNEHLIQSDDQETFLIYQDDFDRLQSLGDLVWLLVSRRAEA